MKKLISICSASILLLAAQSGFACDYPTHTDIPNGKTATKDEMVAAQKGVKSFVKSMETYLDCIVEEEKTARAQMDDLTPEDEQLREDLLNKKYNAAVDDMQKTAAMFNEEVQAYKARDK